VLRLLLVGVPGLPKAVTLKHATAFGGRRCDGLARTITMVLRTKGLSLTLDLTLHGTRWTGTLTIRAPHAPTTVWTLVSGPSAHQLATRHNDLVRAGHGKRTLAWTLTLPRGTPALAP
jgi:hypothetical protein